jgi:hypothetical protein
MRRFIHPWWLLHAASILLYFVARTILPAFWPESMREFDWSMTTESTRETQMFCILGVLLFTKWRRVNSMEAYFSTVLNFSKLAVLFAALVTNTQHFAAFLLLYAIALLAGPSEPHYSGPSNVRDIGLEFFQKCVDAKRPDEAPGASKENFPTYLMQFYSRNEEKCLHTESEYARTSLHYGYPGSTVLFLRISVDAFPSLVDQFQITTPTQSRFDHELPTILMFQAGNVLARLPEVGLVGARGSKPLLNESNMVRAFDLEHRARVPPEALEETTKVGGKLKTK